MTEKNKITEKLSRDMKKNPFRVPDGYFEGFSSRLKDKIAEQDEAKEKSDRISLRPYIYAVGMIAALVVLAFTLFKVLVQNRTTVDHVSSEIAIVFEEDVYDLEETYLIDNYSEMLEGDDIMLSDEDDAYYKNEIIQYLLDENVEIETIVNEL